MKPEVLSKKILEYNQGALFGCLSCEHHFPVKDHPDLVCPECGATPGPDTCEEICEYLPSAFAAKALLDSQAEEEQEETQEQERCDPPGLDDVIGNAAAVKQIRMALEAYRNRLGEAEDKKPIFPHTLWSGPGGTGKTMMSEIIAREIKKPIRLQMGQSLSNPARVGDILLSLKAGDILFIDEMHGLKPVCQETLYRAMEDGVYVPILKAGNAVVPPVKLPPFTLIGATTDEWGLLPSLLQRFKYHIRLERLDAQDLAVAIAQRSERKGWHLDPHSARMIADRAHGTPRLAVQLLDGCMDVAIANNTLTIDSTVVQKTCDIWGLDELGLDKIEQKYLAILAESNGEPVKLNVISSKLDGLARRTVEIRIEPDLVWMGLVDKVKEGRILTEAGREHILKGKL